MPSVEVCGDDLISISVATPADARAMAEFVRATGDWLEVVQGIESVVVQIDAVRNDVATAIAALEEEISGDIPPPVMPDAVLEIPVVYGGDDGPDLDDVCAAAGLDHDAFIALHSGSTYEVELVGFTPGFVYIGGLDERLKIPRRDEPRQSVPAGSVAIADGRTGIYALKSPGGWSIVGRTSYTLFDVDAAEPFPVRAGMRVRFVPVDAAGDPV